MQTPPHTCGPLPTDHHGQEVLTVLIVLYYTFILSKDSSLAHSIEYLCMCLRTGAAQCVSLLLSNSRVCLKQFLSFCFKRQRERSSSDFQLLISDATAEWALLAIRELMQKTKFPPSVSLLRSKCRLPSLFPS